jgi:hypothetical protein
MENESPPVACSLGQADLAQRADRWQALSSCALSKASRTERGVRLVFGAGPGVADELEALAALERECCAFATWSVRAEGGELALEVSGDGEEAVTAVQSMFTALR